MRASHGIALNNMARYGSAFYGSSARYGELDPAPTPSPNNMAQNLIAQTMTDAQRDAMLADLDAFDTKYTNYKTSMTPDEIANLSKLAAENIGLLDMALAYAQQNPGSIPANVSVAGLAQDIALARQVGQVRLKAEQKANQTRNTQIVVLSDGWVTTRKIYRIAQVEGRTPENTAFLDAMGVHFDKEPAPAPAPPTP